jgi:hypothetical protein
LKKGEFSIGLMDLNNSSGMEGGGKVKWLALSRALETRIQLFELFDLIYIGVSENGKSH